MSKPIKKQSGPVRSIRRKKRKQAHDVLVKREVSTYRGIELDKLAKLDLGALSQYMPSRIRRTLLRGFNGERLKLYNVLKNNGDVKPIKTHCRDMVILPSFIDKKVAVHNGKQFVEFKITKDMVGKYFGEFSLTRIKVKHSGAGIGATKSSKAKVSSKN